jgi:hypothetical protein
LTVFFSPAGPYEESSADFGALPHALSCSKRVRTWDERHRLADFGFVCSEPLWPRNGLLADFHAYCVGGRFAFALMSTEATFTVVSFSMAPATLAFTFLPGSVGVSFSA